MEIPKNWEDCTAMARIFYIPPQIIAEAYGIEAGSAEMKRSTTPDKSVQLTLDYLGACERNEVSKALAILREYFETYTQTRDVSEYVFEQAIYLGDKGLASAALQKMIAQTPD